MNVGDLKVFVAKYVPDKNGELELSGVKLRRVGKVKHLDNPETHVSVKGLSRLDTLLTNIRWYKGKKRKNPITKYCVIVDVFKGEELLSSGASSCSVQEKYISKIRGIAIATRDALSEVGLQNKVGDVLKTLRHEK